MVKQWNVSVEHALSDHDVLSAGYIGSAGRHLIRREIGPGSVQTDWLALATNHGVSDYHSLQAHYRTAAGAQILGGRVVHMVALD